MCTESRTTLRRIVGAVVAELWLQYVRRAPATVQENPSEPMQRSGEMYDKRSSRLRQQETYHVDPEALHASTLPGPREPSNDELHYHSLHHDPPMPWCDMSFKANRCTKSLASAPTRVRGSRDRTSTAQGWRRHEHRGGGKGPDLQKWDWTVVTQSDGIRTVTSRAVDGEPSV